MSDQLNSEIVGVPMPTELNNAVNRMGQIQVQLSIVLSKISGNDNSIESQLIPQQDMCLREVLESAPTKLFEDQDIILKQIEDLDRILFCK
ncbi:MAG: hypothetical protein COA94_04870 [Rickettsiales bacterium]|nr:MAG: hypothetical protein COA94_04870 [Rickettsiales bacterium]